MYFMGNNFDMEGNNSLFISGECVEEPGMEHLHGECDMHNINVLISLV